jgi:thiol-disulfide isomerase/thioredoxin
MKILSLIFFVLFACSNGKATSQQSAGRQFKPYSDCTIQLSLESRPYDTLFAEAYVNTIIPRGRNTSKLLAIHNQGEYYLNLQIDRPCAGTLEINNKSYNVVLTPGDTTQILLSPAKEKLMLQFKGKHSEANRYYLNKKEELGYTDIRMPINQAISSRTTYNSFKDKVDSITYRELQYLEKNKVAYKLPDWFVDYERAEIKYMGASFKVVMPGHNKIFSYFKDTLPTNYFDFLDNIQVSNNKALLSASYVWFLDDYFILDLPSEAFMDLAGYTRLNNIHNHILKKSGNTLTPEVKEVFYKYLLSSTIQQYTEPARKDSLALVYQVKEYKDLVQLKPNQLQEKAIEHNLTKGNQVPNFYMTNINDSLVSIRDFKESVVFINIWATWCGPCIANMPAHNKMISQYASASDVKLINICVGSEKDKWKANLAKHKVQGVNLFVEDAWYIKLKTYFNIEGIPHYVILDKGNLLHQNKANKAPAVKAEIDKLLQQTQ